MVWDFMERRKTLIWLNSLIYKEIVSQEIA